MNNANKPAYPTHIGGGKYKLSNGISVEGKTHANELQEKINNDEWSLYENTHAPANEMSKRERFAMAAMQGIISTDLGSAWFEKGKKEAIASHSINQADIMLKMLEEMK